MTALVSRGLEPWRGRAVRFSAKFPKRSPGTTASITGFQKRTLVLLVTALATLGGQVPLATAQRARLVPVLKAMQTPADQPVARTDPNSLEAHRQLLSKARSGRIDVYFEGDSITRRWGATDYPELLANWRRNFFGWNAADFGWGADTTQNILWRLNDGELDGVHPKVIVLLAGTNNLGEHESVGDGELAADITRGLEAILQLMREKAPEATIILTAIFPRNDDMAWMPVINTVNANLAALADGARIRYLNVNDRLADASGRLYEGMMNAQDKLHPTLKGYQIWADALKPILTELLGPPAAEDHAPPPTGNPGIR